MLNKLLIVLFSFYILSPISLVFLSIENKFTGIEYYKTEIITLEEIKFFVEEKFIPQTLLRGEDMTMFYIRNIRPTLPDYNKNYKPVISIKQKQAQNN